MNRIVKWVSTLSVLALSLFMWSCDNVGDMTQPELAPSPMVVTSITGQRYVVAWESDPNAESVNASIGIAGGMLRLGNHSLWVSPGAVSEATVFTMTRNNGNSLRVKLTAGRDSENDVGILGFKGPVRLGLYFADAADVPADKSVITLMYFRPDGLVEELQTQVNVFGNTAFATVSHFSEYGLGWP